MAVANIELRVTSTQAVKALNSANTAAKKLNDTLARSQGAMKSTGSSLRGLGKAGFAAANGSKAASAGLKSVGVAIKTALGPISAIIGGVASLGAAFQVLAQQDFAEAKVRSLGVDSDELTKRLSGVSRELAGQASVVDLTSAAYDVASAGFTNAADAANILKAASQGATGGFSDINTVGDAATSVLNAYGLEADKAAKLVDGFIQTQNDGKIVIGEYAANIAKVAPVAAALGVPLEEVNAAVAQITAGGQGAEVTFTALKTAFAQVAAGKVGDEFKDLGITINSSTLASEGLAGTLQKIKASGADAGTVIKAFGTEAGPSILALLNDTEKFNKLLENQKNSQGAAAKAAFEASDTINGALKRLQTAFSNIFSDGEELGALLKGTFQVAAVTVEFLGAALKATLAPIRGLIAGVNAFFQELAPFGENINLAFELEKAFQAFMGTVSFATDVVTGLFTVIGQGVATQIGNVLNLASSIRDGVVNVFSGLAATIKSTMASLYEQLPAPIKFIIEQAGKGFQAVQGFLGEAVSGVAQQVSGAVVELAKVGGAVQNQPGAQPQGAANAIQQTNRALGGDKPSNKEDDAEAKRAEKIAKASADRVQSLKDQTLLASALTEEEREQFERQIAIRDIVENKRGLTDQQVKSELEATLALHERLDLTEKIKNANEEAAKKKKEADDKEAARVKELNQFYQSVADTIQSGIVDGIMGAIDGTKSLQESLSGILKSVGRMFLNQAIGSIMPTFGAEGGYASGATNAVVGEAGPEYIIPESKMRESMARYARGARGSAVIPENGEGGTNSEGGGVSASTLDVRFNVERINNVDYVTAEQFQVGLARAAQQGAAEGERRAMGSLRNSAAVRRRIGV